MFLWGNVYPKAPFVAPIEADVYPNRRFVDHVFGVLEGSYAGRGKLSRMAACDDTPCGLSGYLFGLFARQMLEGVFVEQLRAEPKTRCDTRSLFKGGG